MLVIPSPESASPIRLVFFAGLPATPPTRPPARCPDVPQLGFQLICSGGVADLAGEPVGVFEIDDLASVDDCQGEPERQQDQPDGDNDSDAHGVIRTS